MAEIEEVDDELGELKDNRIEAYSTSPLKNQFSQEFYVKVADNGTLEPVTREQSPDYSYTIVFEYLTYGKDLEIRRQASVDEMGRQLERPDRDRITLERIRHGVVSWDLHKKISGIAPRLFRVKGCLADESLDAITSLPPLLRRTVEAAVNHMMGYF